MALRQRPTIVAIGDSITEYGFRSDNTNNSTADGWLSLLALHFVGRADVLNRGVSGYTSNQALSLIRQSMPQTHVALVLLGFGSNDAAAKGGLQHVDLETYASNLRTAGHVLLSDPAYGKPVVMFISPSLPTPRWIKDARDPLLYSQYSAKCAQVATELGCTFVDMFGNLTDDHLSDGLHLNAKGNRLLFDLVIQQISTSAPTIANLPVVSEYWQTLLTRLRLPPLIVSRDVYHLFRLPPTTPITSLPANALQGSFASLTRSKDELSIVTRCDTLSIIDEQKASTVWRAIYFGGQLDLSLVGVLSGVLNVLKSAQISVFCIATFDTDWILFDETKTDIVVTSLREAQYQIVN